MSKKQLLPLTIISVAALILVIAMFRAVRPPQEEEAVTITQDGVPIATLAAKASDPVLGDRKATLTVFEFSDFGCEHCAAMVPILNNLVERNEHVRVIWKDVPVTRFPTPSEDAHIAARCAQQQGAFWGYHDELFANQGGFSEVTFFQIADDLELNEDRFRTCLEEKTPLPLIETNVELAQSLALDGTPFFVVGTERFSGSRTLSFFEQVVERQSR
jgi:protein-disulfide isomerase